MVSSISKGSSMENSSALSFSRTIDGSSSDTSRDSSSCPHYGIQTSVPDFDICRLSFYLKCCALGCGLAPAIEQTLLDYGSAHRLPIRLQHYIYHLCRSVFSPESLINRAYYLDDGHFVLPSHVSNAFFNLEDVSTSSLVSTRRLEVDIYGRRIAIHKVMVCTTAWMNEFFIRPLRALEGFYQNVTVPTQEGNSNSGHCSHCRGLDGYACCCDQDCSTCRASQCRPVHFGVRCNGCHVMLRERSPHGISGSRFRCLVCMDCNYCEYCYENGEHDQTHEFERIGRVGGRAEWLGARAVLLECQTPKS